MAAFDKARFEAGKRRGREEQRRAKAEAKRARKHAKAHGVDRQGNPLIDRLPDDVRGVAKTLSYGGPL